MIFLSSKIKSCGTFEWEHSGTRKVTRCNTDESGIKTCREEKEDFSECRPCENPCYTCSGAVSCNSCIPGRYDYLHASYCYDLCPERLWERNHTLTCSPCHSTCQECWDGEKNSCTVCIPGLNLRNDGTCKPKCPKGQYSSSTTKWRCQGCHPTCKECFKGGKYNCLSCSDPSYMLLPDGSCSDKCPKFQYQSEKTCLECHQDCESCFGGFKTSCIKCKNDFIMSTELECIPECKEQSYKFNATHCKPCASGCKKCKGGEIDDCLECLDTVFKHVDSILKIKKRELLELVRELITIIYV